MLKRFLKDSTIYSLSTLVTRGISFLLVPFYTRVFVPSDYGIIDLVAIVASIVSSVFPLQITQAIARLFPDCRDKQESSEYASSGLFFTMFAFILFLAVFLPLRRTIDRFLLSNEIPDYLLIWAILPIAFNGLYYYGQNLLRWRLQPKRFAIASVVYSLVTIGATVVFVLILKAGVVGVFWAQCLGGAVGFTLSFFLARDSYKLRFRWSRFREMVSYSWPLVPSSISIFLLTYADRIMISKLLNMQDLGLFGIGYRISSVVVILMMGVQGAITPLIFNSYRDPNTPREIERIFRYFLVTAVVVTGALSIFSREILIVLTTPKYYSAWAVVPFLVMASFISGMRVFAPGLNLAKKTKTIALLDGFGGLMNVAMNFFLIERLGILGAAISTMVSGFMVFGLQMFFSQKNYHVPHDSYRIGLLGTVAFAAVSTSYLLPQYEFVVSVALKGLLLFLIALAAVSFGLTKDEIKKLFNRSNFSFLLSSIRSNIF